MKPKLSDYELATIAYHRDTLGVNPVAVDVASRVMQVCYYDRDKKLLKTFSLPAVNSLSLWKKLLSRYFSE
ncbi:hypothetical protein [Succinivibrio dextrinosolvens]|uniref:hypothetical protein n=1 Tax=Succinivibrio dextrinosolvens TaxID=83771 RepID=UPI0013E96261|nr:hypothetical protein [Succinivibrio dextrinosolvens]